MNLKPLISLPWAYIGIASSTILARAPYAERNSLDDIFGSTTKGGV